MNTLDKEKLWNKNFVLMLQGNAFSIFGDILYSIAISFWVYEKTNSTTLMGVFASISMFVSMFVTPFAGAVIDRSSRKWMIVGTDFLRSILMFVVAYFAFQDKLSVPMILVVAFIAALCQVFFSPAVVTVFADIVSKEQLVRAQSIDQGLTSLLALVGKALSGRLLLLFGLPTMILANAISFLFSAFSEMFIQIPRNSKEGTKITPKQIFLDVKEGAILTYRNKGLRGIIPFAISVNFLISGMSAMYLPWLLGSGHTLTEYGYLMSVLSFGGIVAMLIMAFIKFSPKQRFFIIKLGFLGGIVFTAFAFISRDFYTITILFFISTILMGIGNAVANAVLILAIPKDQRGLVIGFVVAAATGGVALSTIVYGYLAEFVSLNLLGAIGSLLALIPTVFFVRNKHVQTMFEEEEKDHEETCDSNGGEVGEIVEIVEVVLEENFEKV